MVKKKKLSPEQLKAVSGGRRRPRAAEKKQNLQDKQANKSDRW